jgi:hypothetical protein
MSDSFPNIHQEPEPWRDPALLPKKQTTFDTISESTAIPWIDPATLPKKITTYDQVTQRVTIQAPRNKPGDVQYYGGEIYTFDGNGWVLTK